MFQRYRANIDAALRSSLSRNDVAAYDMLRYCMGWVDATGAPRNSTAGKALRPTVCLFSCEASGGSVEAAMPTAAALEFIHNFSLIHDDIQDRDETRRHRPTLWYMWGTSKALIAGNLLRVIADQCLENVVDAEVEIPRTLDVTGLLTEAYLEMIEGQYLDISYEGRLDMRMDDYMRMISLKTGALIRCAASLGARIGTRDPEIIGAFSDWGRSLGYAFQIRDDVLGVWGDEKTTGKPVGADIRRKKNSLPVLYAMSVATGDDRKLLLQIYDKHELDDDDVNTVLDIMNRAGVKEYAQGLAAEHCRDATQALARIGLKPEARTEADELGRFLLVREH